MCPFKCHGKQDELTYNVGYLSFSDENDIPEQDTQ